MDNEVSELSKRVYALEEQNHRRAQEIILASHRLDTLNETSSFRVRHEAPAALAQALNFLRCTDTHVGPMFYAENDSMIGRSLEVYGEWCANETNLIKQIIQPGDTVLDVGANLGHHSRAFAQMVGKQGTVVSFEPNSFNALLLRLNARLATDLRIQVVNAAVSDKAGFASITSIEPGSEANYGGATIDEGGQGDLCPMVRLDDLRLPIAPSFIKIDVEGHEAGVVNGALDLLRQAKPTLFVEADDENTIEICKQVETLGYDIYFFETFAYRSDNFKNNPSDVWNGGGYSRNVLCLHQDKQLSVSGIERLDTSADLPSNAVRIGHQDVRVFGR